MREMQKATPLARHLTAYFLRNDVGLSDHFKEELETYLRAMTGALGVNGHHASKSTFRSRKSAFRRVPRLTLCEGTVAVANGLAFARRQADGAVIGVYPEEARARPRPLRKQNRTARGYDRPPLSTPSLNGEPSMEAVDVRGRFVWHPVAHARCARRKGVLSQADGLERSALADRPELYGVPRRWTYRRSRHDGDGAGCSRPRCLRTGCSTSVLVTWTPRPRPRCLRAGSSSRQPSEMKGAGRYAVLADPQGAVFADHRPRECARGRQGRAAAGSFLLA